MPVNQAPGVDQYIKAPELNFSGMFPQHPAGLNFGLDSQFIRFDHVGSSVPTGDRYYIAPFISLPIVAAYGYIKPKLQLTETYYNLSHNSNKPDTINRTLPIFDIDAGLYFSRKTHLFGKSYQQTLEPRIFYLYIPNHNQSNIPVFDSNIQIFTFDQMFRTNRFSGLDRIGDANQLTLALTTRFLKGNTGEEKFSASIGQIYYFRDRRVTVCASPGCTDNTNPILNRTSPDSRYSPLVGQLRYFFNPAWNLTTNLAWNAEKKRLNNANFYFQFSPAPEKVFNFGYTFLRGGDIYLSKHPNTIPTNSYKNNLDQGNVSVAWPLSKHWLAVGRYNYNISHSHPQDYFYGLQYKSCCWAVRFVAAKTFTNLDQNFKPEYEKSFVIQFQLTGLGNIGVNNPSSMLTTGIPGYHNNF